MTFDHWFKHNVRTSFGHNCGSQKVKNPELKVSLILKNAKNLEPKVN
jgi:hypothetical protein